MKLRASPLRSILVWTCLFAISGCGGSSKTGGTAGPSGVAGAGGVQVDGGGQGGSGNQADASGQGGAGAQADAATQGGSAGLGGSGGPAPDAGVDAGEVQPAPASGPGLTDPSTALHDHNCAGTDWSLIGGWLVRDHHAPAIASAAEITRCVNRYAGWVTNDADAAGISRAAVYAGLAATGQCAKTGGYSGGAILSGAECVAVHSKLTSSECLAKMASPTFGIKTLAKLLGSKTAKSQHERDPPLMAAYLGHGSVACGGQNLWKLRAPSGFISSYVAAYNGVRAQSKTPPSCSEHPVVTVALYTGMGTPGSNGVAAGNGCWTYERVTKTNPEWRYCKYNATPLDPGGVKWAYDDTNVYNNATIETNSILSCMKGEPARGYVYMANRGSGWLPRVTSGVKVHYAEVYSGQTTVDDQFTQWVNAGKPGHPMVNFSNASTTNTTIHNVTLKECKAGGGWLGLYISWNPTKPFDGTRMGAFVKAMNACTKGP